ncbi:hypothetical protein FFLO_03748 [Filobasidium floriforme]|uniref:Uncharacterized protein n=1 Tax=Filobasidium floriforme TaxID=5210 RepID=A0A8K0JLM3_9TREE|nr:hypothetical protein FFLO_03748 [Filobasidium floriforme]
MLNDCTKRHVRNCIIVKTQKLIRLAQTASIVQNHYYYYITTFPEKVLELERLHTSRSAAQTLAGMSFTIMLLLVTSYLFDLALAATKTKSRSSTKTGVSRTTVTKYRKKGKPVPWSEMSKGAKIAVYVACGFAGLILLVILALFLRRRSRNTFKSKEEEPEATSEDVTPYEKTQAEQNSWAIPPPGQEGSPSYFAPMHQPASYSAPIGQPPQHNEGVQAR